MRYIDIPEITTGHNQRTQDSRLGRCLLDEKIKMKRNCLVVVNSTDVNKCTGVEVNSADINPWTYVVIWARGWLGFTCSV